MNDAAATGAAVLAILTIVGIELLIALFLVIIPGWRMLSKAGLPGWGIIIPIYNFYLWCKMAGRPGWWLLLMLIPVVNIVIAIILALDIAKRFGKSGAWGFFLLGLFSFIGIPILGYGKATYTPAPQA